MRIGVLADTHDRLPALERGLAILQERQVEAIVHAGDLVAPFTAKRLLAWRGPLHVIYGNNDGERRGLNQITDGPLWIPAGGRRVLLHHFIDWCKADDVAKADIIITGHTHEVVSERRDGKLFLNPGECCGWVNGRCTLAVLDTRSLSAEVIEVTP